MKTTEFLFIDANVADKQTLIANVAKNVKVVELNDKTDAISQMVAALKGQKNLDAIHIISHGSEGELDFASGAINSANLSKYTSQLKKIGSSLSATGDLLLYGCDVAKGDDGTAFINSLANVTKADVAASIDFTGAASFGGDWDLENHTGVIEANTVKAADWQHLLTVNVNDVLILNLSYTTLYLDMPNSYFVFVPNNAPAPSADQVLAGQDSTGATALKSGDMTSPAIYITGLTANTDYDIYFVDKADSPATAVTKVDIRTLSLELLYSATTFTEASANDGSITDSLTITLGGDTFTGSDNADWSSLVSNVPAGLTAHLIRTDATTATLSFTGNATAHANANDVNNLTVAFADSYFTGGSAAAVTNATKSDLVIDFADPAVFDILPEASDINITDTTAVLSVGVPNHDEGISFVLVPNNAPAPSVAQVLAGQDSTGASVVAPKSGTLEGIAPGNVTFDIMGLTASTDYDAYVVSNDGSSTTPIKVDIRTHTPDVAPTVTSIDLQTTNTSGTTDANSLLYRVTFSEAVTGIDVTDFVVSAGTTATVTYMYSVSENAYDVVVSGGNLASLNGNVSLSFATGQNITDSVGNALSNVMPTGTDNHVYTVANLNTAPSFSFGAWQTVGTGVVSTGLTTYESLAISPKDGTLYLAYFDNANGNKATVMKFNSGTNSWETVGTGGVSTGTAYNESLVISPTDGTPYLAYEDAANANKATVMKFNGTSWEAVGTGVVSTGQALYESLTIATDGTPYLAYEDYDNGGKATVMKFNSGTNSWEAVGTGVVSTGATGYERLAISPTDGTPYLAYRDDDNSYKATVMKFNGTSWEAVGTGGVSTGGAIWESLAISPTDGAPYLAYEDAANGNKATVMKFNGTSWETVGTGGVSTGGALYESLAIAADGTPYLAYLNGRNGGKATVLKFNGTSWEAVGTGVVSTAAAMWESLAIATDGTPYLAYRHNGNSGKATVMKFAASSNPTFTEGGNATVLAPTVQIIDAELSNSGIYTGSTLTLARHGGANLDDVFSSSVFNGSNIVVGTTTIGTFTNSAGTLFLTFNATATQSLVNSALQAIAYSNSNKLPPATAQIDWTFNDANTTGASNGAQFVTGSTTVNIIAVNVPSSALDVVADVATKLAGFTVADVNVGDTLTVTLIATNGTIDGVTDADNNSANGIQITGSAETINAALAAATFTATKAWTASVNISLTDGNIHILSPVTAIYPLTVSANPTVIKSVDETTTVLVSPASENVTDWWLSSAKENNIIFGTKYAETFHFKGTGNANIIDVSDGDALVLDAATTLSDNTVNIRNEDNDVLVNSVGTYRLGGVNPEETVNVGFNGNIVEISRLKSGFSYQAADSENKYSIVGSTAGDSITGGSGNDTITGGLGADTIDGGAGADKYIISATGETGGLPETWSASSIINIIPPQGSSVSTVGMDIYMMGAGDTLDISAIASTLTTITAITSTITDSTAFIAAGTGTAAAQSFRGIYADNTFTSNANGNDTLLVYDNNGSDPGGANEAVVLVGTTSVEPLGNGVFGATPTG